MKNLIVTAAGLSSRFEGLKPKWMLTHPKGNWMITDVTYKAGVKIPFDDRTNWLRMTVGPNLSDTDFIKKLLN